MSVEMRPYFAEGERYPALIGVRADGDEYETAYVRKAELVDVARERDELRELVRELWHELDAATQYDAGGGRSVVYEFAERMRELGVEVDV